MTIKHDKAKAAEMAAGSAVWAAAGSNRSLRLFTGAAATLLAIVLGVAAVGLMDRREGLGLTPLALERLDESGVEHTVTAVLLNFRSVDTWLELSVLVLAVMAMLTLQRSASLTHLPRVQRGGFVLSRMTGIFIPLMVIGAGYLLWRGTHAPGGAFQAGALLGAAGVMLRLSGRGVMRRMPGGLLRGSIVASFALFAIAGVTFMLQRRAFLEYPTAHAGMWIFIIELIAAVSIGVALWALFVGANAAPWRGTRVPAGKGHV